MKDLGRVGSYPEIHSQIELDSSHLFLLPGMFDVGQRSNGCRLLRGDGVLYRAPSKTLL